MNERKYTAVLIGDALNYIVRFCWQKQSQSSHCHHLTASSITESRLNNRLLKRNTFAKGSPQTESP